ncbi:hypothetical protein J6590_025239 [Homalodisca vitripennis]|nr:hypothetical protein J6590_025239 [Homalodisca vitripennis]
MAIIISVKTAGLPVVGRETRNSSLDQGKTVLMGNVSLVVYSFEDAEILYYDIKYNGTKRYMGRTTKKPKYFAFQYESFENNLELFYEGDMNDDDDFEYSDDHASLWSFMAFDILFMVVIILTACTTIAGKCLKNK